VLLARRVLLANLVVMAALGVTQPSAHSLLLTEVAVVAVVPFLTL
jgi:hypothetical protein